MKTIGASLLLLVLIFETTWPCNGEENGEDLFSHFFPGMGKKSDFSGTSTSASAKTTTSTSVPGSGAGHVEGEGRVSTQARTVVHTSTRSRRSKSSSDTPSCTKLGGCDEEFETSTDPFSKLSSSTTETSTERVFPTIATKGIDFESLKRKYFYEKEEEDDDFPPVA